MRERGKRRRGGKYDQKEKGRGTKRKERNEWGGGEGKEWEGERGNRGKGEGKGWKG